jgi:peptidoglycan/xylan/chitin deacetylase (PgdA/CDA1 family)
VHELARTVEGLPPEELDAVATRIREFAGGSPCDRGLDAAEIAGLARNGFSIGFHTRDHQALTTLDDAALHRALAEGVDELEAVAGRPLTAIAYPYCRADLRVADAAMRSGFELGVTCNQRPVGAHDHPLLIDRVDGWSPSLGNFALALAWAAASAR